MSPETALFEYYDAAILAAAPGSILDGCALHETIYQPINSLKGLRIGDVQSDIAPRRGEYKEFNVIFPVQIFRRVDDGDYTAAREELRDLELKAIGLIFDSPSLGSRVCDCQVLLNPKPVRGWARIQTTPYAAAAFYVIVDSFGLNTGGTNT
jgi:hypothetical protein